MIPLRAAGLAAAGLLTLSALAPAQEPPGQPRPPVRLTDSAGMDADVAALIEQHVSAVAASPADGNLHAELGLVYEANTFFSPAARCYENAVALLPDRPEWLYRQGVALYATGDTTGALEVIRRVADKLKNTPVIQALLGSLLLDVGDVEGASAAWEQAIAAEAKQPGQATWPQSRAGLAQVRMQQERWDEALTLLQEALRQYPTYRQAHYLLGLCYLEQGDEEQAELELKRGVGARPELPPDPHQPRLDAYQAGFFQRMMNIEVMVNGGQAQEAYRALTEVLARRPSNHHALNLLAKVQLQTGQPVAALATLRSSEAANPNSYMTKVDLAVTLMNLLPQEQDPERQKAMVQEIQDKTEQAVQLAPYVGRAHFFRGLALRLTGNPQDPSYAQVLTAARQELSAALTLGCQEPGLFEQLATLYALTGRRREMIEFAKVNVDRQPDNPAAHLFLAQAHMTNGDHDAALASAARAIEVAPENQQVIQFKQALEKAVEQAKSQAKQAGQKGSGKDDR